VKKMKFTVQDEVFSRLEHICFGVVVAAGIDNRGTNSAISELLANIIQATETRFSSETIRDARELTPYREAFNKLAINPNKFMSSIEAMVSRIAKGKGLPHINPAVDLGNAVSLKHLVPLGAHDLDSAGGDIGVRFSMPRDRFVPFGGQEEEQLEQGELIYSVGDKVKTRRWIWRQSEHGKVTAETRNIFFPIDGFMGLNAESVLSARDELASLLQQYFSCAVKVGFINKDNREMPL
jgi:DNA/RNA-binding domain of Phe-tRNA-synthetase-like protein